MAKQVLEIGNTGSDLVSKFNNNFDEIYTEDSIIKEIYGYVLTENGCVGDGLTNDTTAFSALLTGIGSNYATIIINDGRFLIGSCTIPENVELNFVNGGRIVWLSGSTITIHGHINAGHKWIFENQSELSSELPSLQINRQEWVSPIWFGGQMSGDNADATINYNALRSAWNCVSRLSQTQDGGKIKFPAGTFIMNGMISDSDGWDSIAKYANIEGAGRTKTTIMLASGQNKALWYAWGSYDFQIKDIAFNGNAANNTAMTDPLLLFGFYRTDLIDVKITNCTANGIEYIPGQNNAHSIINPLIYDVGGIGIYFNGVINAYIGGIINIESTSTGITFDGYNTTLYDSRESARAVVEGSWYGETVTDCIVLNGVSAVNVKVAFYARSSQSLVKIKYDEVRNIPSLFNTIDVRGSHDFKDTSYVRIEDKNPFNMIYVDGFVQIIDLDGRNGINGIPGCTKTLGLVRGATIYNERSLPLAGHTGDGNIFNDGIAHFATSNKSIHKVVYPTDDQIETHQTVLFSDLETKYYVCVIKGDPGKHASLYIRNETTLDVYDHPRKEWITPEDMNAYNNRRFIFDLNGQWQTFCIPFIPQSTGTTHQFFLYCQGYYLYCCYGAIFDRNDAVLHHIKSSTVIGYENEDAFYNQVDLPPATEVGYGTTCFVKDLGYKVVSNGVNWKKPDGNNL